MGNTAIIGATTWGSTIGWLLARQGMPVTVWARREARAKELEKREMDNYPTGARQMVFTHSLDKALHHADLVVWGIPAQGIRQNVKTAADHLSKSAILVSLAKGLEANTGKRMSEIIAEEVPAGLKERICVLSGPNLAQEIRRGLPATTIIASQNAEPARYLQKLLNSDLFYAFTSSDVAGVELCGALKNVIALGAGMTDGLDLGDNTKSAFITLGWADVLALGLAMGAQNSTIYGLAGLGDVFATSASNLSRNHYVGCEVAKGRKVEDVLASMENVAEGVDTTMAVSILTRKYRVHTPILDLVNTLLFNPMETGERIRLFKDALKSGYRS